MGAIVSLPDSAKGKSRPKAALSGPPLRDQGLT
jgi:hypothetical protein